MQRSEQPHIELNRAAAALEAMRTAKTLADFEESWKELLRRIERTWYKTQSHYQSSPKWHSWHGPFENRRKTDPLLSYLINARGADEHSVTQIVAREPSELAINAPEENSNVHIDFANLQFTVRSPQRLNVEFTPGRTKLIPIVNRGRTYAVPTEHLGNRIDPENVFELGEAAIAFYRGVLDQAERYFVR